LFNHYYSQLAAINPLAVSKGFFYYTIMSTTQHNKEWFATWFDTHYYHVLYANRDDQEAEFFISNLMDLLQPNPETASILDLACGKGRHSVYMNKLGFRVTGVDLSPQSIAHASQFSQDRLRFQVQDMREAMNEKFTHIFNLFTSFGYFDSIEENQKVMQAIQAMTTENGILVIDYLNAFKTVKNLVHEETKILNNIRFDIERQADENHVYKYINVTDDDFSERYMERVQLLKLSDFETLLSQIGFKVTHSFGDFQLNPFDEEQSDRLILIAQKQ
jgi:SAM-dependent methyltransferase